MTVLNVNTVAMMSCLLLFRCCCRCEKTLTIRPPGSMCLSSS